MAFNDAPVLSDIGLTNDTESNVTGAMFHHNMMVRGPSAQVLEFKKYAYVITNPVGIICNMFVFYIFTRTKLKRPSTARYLAATAIADSGFLLASMMINLSEFNITVYHRIGICQLVTFGQHAFPFLIRWYLCCAVVDKFIGVNWPRKKPKMCTVFRAKCVVISLAIMAIVCYLYVTWFFYANHYKSIGIVQCTLAWDDIKVLRSWLILTKMDAVVNFGLPYILMLILTCLIAVRSWKYHRNSMSAGERFLRRRGASTPEDKELKTTPLIIVTASVSIILCAPNSVQRLRELDPTFTPSSPDAQMIMVYFEVLNSCLRILIYTFCSHRFARQMGKICTCLCRKRNVKRDNSALNMTEIDRASTIRKDIETASERNV